MNEKTSIDCGFGLDMNTEFLIVLVIIFIIPTCYSTYHALKKGRNFFISLILSFIFYCAVWIGFGLWMASLMWAYELIDGLKITWWIVTPLYFVICGTTAFLQFIFSGFFAALWHNYDNEGIIKVGIIKPKFINKLLNNKD